MVEKIKRHLGDLKGKTIGILGLAFKQKTPMIFENPRQGNRYYSNFT